MNWILIGLVAALAIYLGRRAARQWASRAMAKQLPEREVIDRDDPDILEAEERARAERPFFLERMKSDVSGGYVALRDPRSTEIAWQWAEVIEAQDEQLSIRMVDDDTELSVPLGAIADWQIEEDDGRLRGGYTVRVILDRLASSPQAGESSVAQRARYL